MNKLFVILAIAFSFFGCSNEDKELKKLQLENEKMKNEILKKQISAENENQKGILFQWEQLYKAYQRRINALNEFVRYLDSQKSKIEEETIESLQELKKVISEVESVSMAKEINPISRNEYYDDFLAQQNKLIPNIARLVSAIDAFCPEVKSAGEYKDFLIILEATENRITLEKLRFNELK